MCVCVCVCVYSWYEEITKIPIDESTLMESVTDNLIIRLGGNDGNDEDKSGGENNNGSYTEDELFIEFFFPVMKTTGLTFSGQKAVHVLSTPLTSSDHFFVAQT